MTDIEHGKHLFDGPTQDGEGVWHSNKLSQLLREAKAVLAINPASWLGALGLVLLLQKLKALYKTERTLLQDAGLTDEDRGYIEFFVDSFQSYLLPKDFALDVVEGAQLVRVQPSDIHDDKRSLVIIDLVAFHALVDKCGDLVAAQVASGTVVLPDDLKLRAK